MTTATLDPKEILAGITPVTGELLKQLRLEAAEQGRRRIPTLVDVLDEALEQLHYRTEAELTPARRKRFEAARRALTAIRPDLET